MNERPAGDGPDTGSAACAVCGGTIAHTPRQRCPAVPPPRAAVEQGAPAGGATTGRAFETVPVVAEGVFAPAHPRFVAPRRPQGRVQASPFTFWRTVFAVAAMVAAATGAGLYVHAIFDDLTSADEPPGRALAWIGGSALLAAAGLVAAWWISRAYAKILLALLSVVLVVSGFFMLIFAPVFRQVLSAGIAEYRASDGLYFFGALTLGGGIALAAACVRWATRPAALERLNRWRRPLGAAYGGLLALFGLMVLSLVTFVIVAGEDEAGGEEYGAAVALIAITALGAQFFIPGIVLMHQGIASSIGGRSKPFWPPPGALVALAFAAVIVGGQLIMRMESPVAAPMPFLHVLAAGLPGLAYIAFAMRGSWLRGLPVRGITWRQITLAWGLAIAVGAMSAGFVNSIAGFGVTVLLLVQSGAFEGLGEISASGAYDVFDTIADADFILSHNEQWVANIIAIAIIPPLGEEFLKGLSVRFLMLRTMTRAQAFALGAAAGAGFGFAEALLYGAAVVSDDAGAWWLIMLIRAGSTSLHCLNTGLAGLAWWYWSIARRKRPALALFLAAVLLHALWNGFSVTLESEILWVGTLEDRTLEYIAYGFVVVFAAAFIAAIPRIGRALREGPPSPVAGTPLAAMEPWVGEPAAHA